MSQYIYIMLLQNWVSLQNNPNILDPSRRHIHIFGVVLEGKKKSVLQPNFKINREDWFYQLC